MGRHPHLRPLPPGVLRRMAADLRRLALRAVDGRQPLVRPSPEELQRQLDALGQELDAHGSPIPKGLTEAEKQAALDPGIAPKEQVMETTPGYKTTEFWLHALVTLVVIPVLAWLANQAVSPLGDMLSALASGNAILAAVVLAVKPAVFAVLAWAVAQLQAKYAENRTALKIAHVKARAA